MTTTTGVTIDAAMREDLAGLADVLIPATSDMPSASQADVQGKWLDRVLKVRPDVAPALLRVLAESRGKEPAAEVRRLQVEDPDGFAALYLVATGGYYLNPRVRRLIGYPGQKSNAPYPDEADYYLRDGLLDPVITRGPRYRPTP